MSLNTFNVQKSATFGGQTATYFDVLSFPEAKRLPFTHKILLENLLRLEDGKNVTADQIRALLSWDPQSDPSDEIQFTPARVIMQDFTGVPCIVDLATMRQAMKDLGGDVEMKSDIRFFVGGKPPFQNSKWFHRALGLCIRSILNISLA